MRQNRNIFCRFKSRISFILVTMLEIDYEDLTSSLCRRNSHSCHIWL